MFLHCPARIILHCTVHMSIYIGPTYYAYANFFVYSIPTTFYQSRFRFGAHTMPYIAHRFTPNAYRSPPNPYRSPLISYRSQPIAYHCFCI
jgi:hypothetical protein